MLEALSWLNRWTSQSLDEIVGCVCFTSYYPGQKKKLRQARIPKYRHVHARESTHLHPPCAQLSQFFGEGSACVNVQVIFFFWKRERKLSDLNLRLQITKATVEHIQGERGEIIASPSHFPDFHETGLESLKNTSARCFLLKCQRKTRKKRKGTASFVASLGAGILPRSTIQLFMLVSGVAKPPFCAVFSRLWGVIWRGKAFRDQQCQFLTTNKSLSSENESNCSMTSKCVRIDSILARGAGFEHGRSKRSIFSHSIFGILVKRLSFQRLHFCSDFVTVFFIVYVYAKAKLLCYRFFNFDLRKKLCFIKADRVG